MEKETKSSKIETQNVTDGESNTVATVEVEEELKKLMMNEVEESKNATTAESETFKKATTTEGEELKNVTTTKTEDMKKVKLQTSDDIIFEVELSIVKEMETIQSFLEFNGNDNSIVIPLPNVTSRSLTLILEYFVDHYRLSEAGNLDELKEFDKQFVEELNTDKLKELLLAANYLNMKNFFELVCKSIVNNIKNKSVEFIRDIFGLVNDYTLEEEAEYQQNNVWAFQKINQD